MSPFTKICTVPSAAFLIAIFYSCHSNSSAKEGKQSFIHQDSIIQEFATGCAHQYNYNIQMKDWQDCLDQGLAKDSTIAYLWQQKAMPYFKARKYEVGMDFLDRAVKYDPEKYLSYRAFIKCIFLKNYREAIIDFTECQDKWGESYEMDHSYSFYIALSHLQLNHFEEAEKHLKSTIAKQIEQHGEAHHIDLFYYAIVLYELEKHQEAVNTFDKALALYPQFSDAMYYKARCQWYLDGDEEKYAQLVKKAEKYGKQKYTINESNSVYEPYPYQIDWK